MKRLTPEEALHRQICSYLEWNYRGAMFNSDMSGVRISMQQAVKAKHLRSSRGYPDLAVYEPKGSYHGLFIEIKTLQNSPFKKDGSLKSDKHVIEQAHIIEKLKKRGYYARFCVGFDEAKRCIDDYMNCKL